MRVSGQRAVDGELFPATDDQCRDAGQIKQVCLIARLAEMGAARRDLLELDRGEAVLKVNREDGHQQHHRHGNADQGYKRAEQNAGATRDFRENGGPR